MSPHPYLPPTGLAKGAIKRNINAVPPSGGRLDIRASPLKCILAA